MCRNYSREETIHGRKLYEEIRYFKTVTAATWSMNKIMPVSIALAEVTSTQDVINNQSITNFNEESIIECVDETFNETVDETLNEAINETFNEAINETFNDTNLIEDEDELFLVLQPPQQVSTLNFLNSVELF